LAYFGKATYTSGGLPPVRKIHFYGLTVDGPPAFMGGGVSLLNLPRAAQTVATPLVCKQFNILVNNKK